MAAGDPREAIGRCLDHLDHRERVAACLDDVATIEAEFRRPADPGLYTDREVRIAAVAYVMGTRGLPASERPRIERLLALRRHGEPV